MKNVELIAGIIIVILMVVSICVQLIMPTQTTIIDPLRDLLKFFLKQPWPKTIPFPKNLVYEKSMDIDSLEGKPLIVEVSVEGVLLELFELENNTAFTIKAYSTSSATLERRPAVEFRVYGEYKKLTISARGLLVELGLNTQVLRQLVVTGRGAFIQIDLNNTNLDLNLEGGLLIADLYYRKVERRVVKLYSKGSMINIDVETTKNMPTYLKYDITNSFMSAKVDERTLNIPRTSIGEHGVKGGLEIYIEAKGSFIDISINR